MAHLLWGGCDTVELAKQFGTPLYVMDEDILRSRCRRLKAAVMDKYQARACYAGKAFLNLAMVQLVGQEGLGLDVVSAGELYIARRAGFPMNLVMVHGNAKTDELLQMALDAGVGHIVVDSEDELSRLEQLAVAAGRRQRILFRLSPGIEAHTFKAVQTAQKDCKFGIPLDHLERAVKNAMASRSLELTGLHVHLGSQIREIGTYIQAVDVMTDIIAKLKQSAGFDASELDFGGGFGIPNLPGDPEISVEPFIEAIMKRLRERCTGLKITVPFTYFEPGRWIPGEAGITLYCVQSVKDIPGVRTYVAVDGGMTDNPRPQLYQAEYRCALASDTSRPVNSAAAVAGPCCESGDILNMNVPLPEVHPGEVLAVFLTGAYNFSMFNGYNCTRRPAVIFVAHGVAREVVKRQTLDDLLYGELPLE